MSNYSGATAGQVTQNLANLSNKLQTGQANTAGILQGLQGDIGAQASLYGQDVTNANNMTSGQGNIYNEAYTGSINAYQQAVNQMSTAATAMNNIEQLAQTQGTATANQIRAYQQARSNWVSARASAANSYAQAALANQKTILLKNTNQKAMNDTMSQGKNGYFSFKSPSTTKGGSRALSAASYAAQTGQTLPQLLQTMVASGNTAAQPILNELVSRRNMSPQQLANWMTTQSNMSPYIWGDNSSQLSSILGGIPASAPNVSAYGAPAPSAPQNQSGGGFKLFGAPMGIF
jgi:hypothetical protein